MGIKWMAGPDNEDQDPVAMDVSLRATADARELLSHVPNVAAMVGVRSKVEGVGQEGLSPPLAALGLFISDSVVNNEEGNETEFAYALVEGTIRMLRATLGPAAFPLIMGVMMREIADAKVRAQHGNPTDN